MPNCDTSEPDVTEKPKSARLNVFQQLLAFAKAMRTAPALTADEAAEWVSIEQEFTKRHDDEKAA